MVAGSVPKAIAGEAAYARLIWAAVTMAAAMKVAVAAVAGASASFDPLQPTLTQFKTEFKSEKSL